MADAHTTSDQYFNEDNEDELGDQELQPLGKNVSLNLTSETGQHDLSENSSSIPLDLGALANSGTSPTDNFAAEAEKTDESSAPAPLGSSKAGASENAPTLPHGLHNNPISLDSNAQYVSPVVSPQTWMNWEPEVDLAVRQFVELVSGDDFAGQSGIHKKANELFQDFLKTPFFVQQSRDFFVAAVCRYLIDSGNFEKNPDASNELLRSLKVDDILGVNGKLGTMHISEFLGANNCFVPVAQIESAGCSTAQHCQQVTATVQSQDQMEIDSQTNQFITNDGFHQEETGTSGTTEEKMSSTVQLNHPFVAFDQCQDQHQQALNWSSSQVSTRMKNIPNVELLADQSSSHGKLLSKQTVLLKKIEGDMNLAYIEMERCASGDTNKHEKIKIGGKVLFTALFTLKEILEGTVSGAGRNKGTQKYDEKKVALFSQLLAWLLEKPRERTANEFMKYQEQTQSVGLVGADYEVAFKKVILVEHANFLRGKYKPKNKKTDVGTQTD